MIIFICILHVEWQTQRVPDICLKPDGSGYKCLPVGTDMRFYLQPLCCWEGICSTLTCCHPYPDHTHQLGRVAQAWGTAPTSSLRPASLAGRPGSASAGVERLQCAPLRRHTARSCPNATCLPCGHAALTLVVGGCQSPLVGSSAITGLAVQHQLGTHAIRRQDGWRTELTQTAIVQRGQWRPYGSYSAHNAP
jgi:hypothetical protein